MPFYRNRQWTIVKMILTKKKVRQVCEKKLIYVPILKKYFKKYRFKKVFHTRLYEDLGRSITTYTLWVEINNFLFFKIFYNLFIHFYETCRIELIWMLISSNEIINIFIQIIEFETSPIFDAFLAVKKIISFFTFGNLLIWRRKKINIFEWPNILWFLDVPELFFYLHKIRQSEPWNGTRDHHSISWIFEKFNFTKKIFRNFYNDWSSGWNTTMYYLWMRPLISP